jgi:hypothetical protein
MTAVHEQPPSYPMTREYPFDPPPGLLRVQAGARITRVTLWDGSTPWLVTGFDQARAVLADPRVSANAELAGYPHQNAGSAARHRLTKTFMSMDDPRHRELRGILAPEFTAKRVESWRPMILGFVDQLVDDLVDGPKPVDLVQAIGLALPSLVICEILGVPYEDRTFFHELSRSVVSPSPTPAEAERTVERYFGYVSDLIDRKADEPTDDLISRLTCEQYKTGAVTRSELVSMCWLLLIGGHETTSNMIALGTAALLLHPAELAELRATDDPAVIAGAVEELLRWLTILHLGRRRIALADIEIGGTLIRRGEGIVVAHDAANRDPVGFPDPGTLDIHREARHHLAFGFGVHQCLGQSLARVELQVVYGTLYRRVPTLALAVDPADVPYKYDNIVYGVHQLPVTW